MTDYDPESATQNLGGSGTGIAKALARDMQWCITQIKAALGIGVLAGVWYTGHGLPSDDLGKDGDLYLNIDTADVYQKENSTWF